MLGIKQGLSSVYCLPLLLKFCFPCCDLLMSFFLFWLSKKSTFLDHLWNKLIFVLLTFANLYIKLWGLEMNLNTKVHHKTVFSKWCVLKISPLKMIFSCETMHFWITFSIVIFSNHSLEVRLWQLPLVRLPFYHGPQIENTQTCLLNWSDIHVELFFFSCFFFSGFSGGFSGVVIAVLQLRLSGFHFKCPVSKARSSYPVSSALHFKKRGKKKKDEWNFVFLRGRNVSSLCVPAQSTLTTLVVHWSLPALLLPGSSSSPLNLTVLMHWRNPANIIEAKVLTRSIHSQLDMHKKDLSHIYLFIYF